MSLLSILLSVGDFKEIAPSCYFYKPCVFAGLTCTVELVLGDCLSKVSKVVFYLSVVSPQGTKQWKRLALGLKLALFGGGRLSKFDCIYSDQLM